MNIFFPFSSYIVLCIITQFRFPGDVLIFADKKEISTHGKIFFSSTKRKYQHNHLLLLCLTEWFPLICTIPHPLLHTSTPHVKPGEWFFNPIHILFKGNCSIVFLLLNNRYTIVRQDSNPPKQSHASYEVSALPPSHHGWVFRGVIILRKPNKYL